jgi:hypothetical protein
MVAIAQIEDEWRIIPGTDGIYSANASGCIRRELINTGIPRIVRGSPNSQGYLCCTLYLTGRRIPSKIHTLIAMTFMGPRPPGYHVNHISGIKTDNAITNLEYVTLEENLAHARRMGIAGGGLSGAANPTAKLTDDQVRSIRQRRPAVRLRDLAKEYGVTITNISHIARRKTWRHIA